MRNRRIVVVVCSSLSPPLPLPPALRRPVSCLWTDNPIVAGQTPIKAAHLNEIRACLDAILTNWPDVVPPPSDHPPIQAYPSCATMHTAGWTLGVNRNGGTYDDAGWNAAEIQTYNLNTARDRDGDGHACETGGEGPTGFNAGTWRVGTDIAPGRYFTSPGKFCEWERLDASGARVSDMFLERLVTRSDLQEIADVKASDHSFRTTCEPWQSTPTASVGTSISSGRWLVGEQVVPGRYGAHADRGCYWAVLRGFSGSISEIIESEYIEYYFQEGYYTVTISASDVGFDSSSACGVWTSRRREPRFPHWRFRLPQKPSGIYACDTPGRLQRTRLSRPSTVRPPCSAVTATPASNF